MLIAAALGWAVVHRLAAGDGSGKRSRKRGPAPVMVAPVEVGAIEERHTFAGTLEARASFVVAAHVGGRVERLFVDLADPVKQGQVIAELDDAEHVQTSAAAAAELAVARANFADSESALAIAKRELRRLEELRKQDIVSDAQLDSAISQHLAKDSATKVARAHITRATAALRRARIRSGYARVIATWSDDDGERVVAARHVDEGENVSANDPLVTVVTLAPIKAVVHVTEKQYGRLAPGHSARVLTDAFPDREFSGVVRRIAPVFAKSSRQARVEIEIANEDRALKPGMFVRVEVMLRREEQATVVPFLAITTRDGHSGVFVVDGKGERVAWRPVDIGIRQGERVQVIGAGVVGRVVTLGQQLIDDGAAIVIPDAVPVGGSGEDS